MAECDLMDECQKMEIEVPGVSTAVCSNRKVSGAAEAQDVVVRRVRVLHSQRAQKMSTCRKPDLSPTKIPQHIQSDHFFVPSGRSKCISTNKTGRQMQASHQNTRQPSHIVKLSISYKMANDIACPSSKLSFPFQEDLTASVGQWHRVMAQSYVPISRYRAKTGEGGKKGKEKKMFKSYGYCCLSY